MLGDAVVGGGVGAVGIVGLVSEHFLSCLEVKVIGQVMDPNRTDTNSKLSS
jgi:hypothetical protein